MDIFLVILTLCLMEPQSVKAMMHLRFTTVTEKGQKLEAHDFH